MKLAIFGATGRTGQHLVQQALDAGHEVAALARNPARLRTRHDHLTVIPGDVTDPACVDQVVAGADAVLSVLGPTENKPDYKVSRGTQHIISAMQRYGMRRLIISAGAGVGDPKDSPALVNRLINVLLKLTARYVYEDMRRAVDLVRASDLDWTVVRVPMLADDPPTGSVRVAWVGKGMGMRITRADMARFMLDQLADTRYLRQAPAISN